MGVTRNLIDILLKSRKAYETILADKYFLDCVNVLT